MIKKRGGEKREMQANLARSEGSGNGGGSADQWELIETFTGTGSTTTKNQESNGNAYSFKAIAVEATAISTNSKNVKLDGAYVSTDDCSNSIALHVPSNATLKSAGSALVVTALRVNGLVLDVKNVYSNRSFAELAGNITGITMQFTSISGYNPPTNVQFKIYTIRA